VKVANAPDETVLCVEAPGRVEVLGNHTDYNEGVVLAAAINRTIRVGGSMRDDGRISLISTSYPPVEIAVAEVRPNPHRRFAFTSHSHGDARVPQHGGEGVESHWTNYPLGVVSELLAMGIPIRGFSAAVESDLPAGIGLGSSAAFAVATAFFILKLYERELPPLEIAKLCQRSEHRFSGVQSGLLDQVTSIFAKAGELVFFDCRTEEIRTIRFPDDLAFVVADSGTKRQLAASEYNLRREQTRAAAAALGVRSLRDVSSAQLSQNVDLAPVLQSRAAHVIGENERVWRAIELLERGENRRVGELMNASHESSRLNFENSTTELDNLVDLARKQPGILGARLTGGGFGGAIVALCEKAPAGHAARNLASAAAQTIVCCPADGALVRN
jgi:galactokinase